MSTKSKSEDKDSYYDKESFYEAECASVRKASESDSMHLAKQFSKSNERKDQRRPSEQSSLCSYLTCPKAIRISTGDALRSSREALSSREASGESSHDLSGKLRESHFGDVKRTPELRPPANDEGQAAAKKANDQPGQEQATSSRKRLWEIYGDITLLNQARLKLLKQRAASRQLNYQPDENGQSNTICKKETEIELKEFRQTGLNGTADGRQFDRRFDQSHSSSRSTSQNLAVNAANRSDANQRPITTNLDQCADGKRRALYKQSVSSSRSSSQTTKNHYHLVCKEEAAMRKPLINPVLNQVIFHQQTRSQPPSLSQTPRPASTNSSPCNR